MPESKINFINDLLPKMKDIAADAIKATFIKLNPNRREFDNYSINSAKLSKETKDILEKFRFRLFI